MGGRLWDVVIMDCLATEFENPVLGKARWSPTRPAEGRRCASPPRALGLGRLSRRLAPVHRLQIDLEGVRLHQADVRRHLIGRRIPTMAVFTRGLERTKPRARA